jgi:hypothetical protein
LEHDGVGRLVALEDLRLEKDDIGRLFSEVLIEVYRHQCCALGVKPVLHCMIYLLDSLFVLAECKRLRLCGVRTSVRFTVRNKACCERAMHSRAKKLESKIRWCSPPEIGFSVSTGARKSAGMSLVP